MKKYDIIVPVPISKERYKNRGYNQTSIFASRLAKYLQIEYSENTLKKVKNNKPQSLLSQGQREQNVQNAYKIIKYNIDKILNKNVLLVDDIFTTGSTLNECSKILNKFGAENIDVFTIAKD